MDYFEGIGVKFQRARQHIEELITAIETFVQRQPYETWGEDEPETGDRVIRVRIREQPPTAWAGIIGDAVHNLRASLDYLAWGLVKVNGGTPTNQTMFPILESSKDIESRVTRAVHGAAQEAIDLIVALKPFQGGDADLWRLHRLDIVDKHRLLMTVGHAHRHIEIDFGKMMSRDFGSDSPFQPFSLPLPLKPSDRQFPLQDGAEVYRVKPAARHRHNDEDVKVAVEIAFGKGDVIQGVPVLATLGTLLNRVERLVELFRPFFAGSARAQPLAQWYAPLVVVPECRWRDLEPAASEEVGMDDEGPWLQCALFCKEVTPRKGAEAGMVDLVGVIQEVTWNAESPDVTAPPSGTIFPVVLYMRFIGAGSTGAHRLAVWRTSPDGARAQGLDQEIMFPTKQSDSSLQVVMQTYVELRQPGVYWHDIVVDGRTLASVPFRVDYQSAGS
jgi:hypothetical protein